MSLLPPASTKSGSDERVKGVGRGKSNQKIAGTPATEPVGDSPGGDEPSLPKLLSALALGARAANGLPPLQNRSEQSSSDDDEFSYLMAFPEFSSRVHEGRAELAVLLSDVLRSVHISSHTIDGDEVRNSTYEDDYGFDSPVLWEKAAEACESLLEDVDVYVQSAKDGSSAVAAASALENAAAKAMTKSRDGYAMLMAGLVDMKVRYAEGLFNCVLSYHTCIHTSSYSACHSHESCCHCIFQIRFASCLDLLPSFQSSQRNHKLHLVLNQRSTIREQSPLSPLFTLTSHMQSFHFQKL